MENQGTTESTQPDLMGNDSPDGIERTKDQANNELPNVEQHDLPGTQEELGGDAVEGGTRTRSGQISNPPVRLTTLYVPWEVFHDESLEVQEKMEDPISFAVSSNPDILYLDGAMKADDSAQFRKAMAGEVHSHDENEHWEVMKRANVLKEKKSSQLCVRSDGREGLLHRRYTSGRLGSLCMEDDRSAV